MKENVFYGKGMAPVKKDFPEIYDAIVELNDAVYTGKVLDYKTQKLIAVAITASNSDDRAIKKQFQSAIQELGATKDELMDVLRIVLLTSGMPPFVKAVRILYEVTD
ncbi:carboxymuconolactone decarboxylase family protein [Methanobrevibacter sp. TMH8]|uniref:carboxymuconolactone decarboxylase family protein n=1 Tax=Methanobrevibacter sp. TMH8 TaxID=2848611 RepID=UPI001CC98465|nr:carboxymuconolactone decarboxylase family protein [Methanobrevibacter sp. TMH8]MBZ9571347.1 carboxymuconolactone decarboxylase family protein [Methanobrevibacter sp. TMH8]